MIIDTLDHFGRYVAIHPLFSLAREFLARGDLDQLPTGRHNIGESDGLFAIVTNAGGHADHALLEAHRDHIDIQVVLGGAHDMGWRPLADCRAVSTPHDDERDVAFYNDAPRFHARLETGDFAILFPEDAHAPTAVEGLIHKIVVKVPVINH